MVEAFWTHTKILVIVLSIIIRKLTKNFFPFTSFFPFFSEIFFLPKSVFFASRFLPDAFYIDVEPKLMIPEAVNDVCMLSLCFHEIIFLLSLVIISVCWEWAGNRNLLGDFKKLHKKYRYRLGIKVGIVLISISVPVAKTYKAKVKMNFRFTIVFRDQVSCGSCVQCYF